MSRAETAPHAGPTTRPRRARGRSRARTVWIPRQHGAWAMLTVPFLVGAVRGGWTWLHLPLAVSWVVGYLGFAAAGTWVKTGKPVYRAPTLTFGVAALVAGLILVAARPALLWWALPVAPLAAVSLWYSRRRNDRALGNDVVTILVACLMTLVAASAGVLGRGGLGATVTNPVLLQCTVVLTLYFVGTVLYVKTLIRERRSHGYKVASIAYHAVATLLVLAAPFASPVDIRPPLVHHIGLVVFFAVATVRAAVLAGRTLRPMKVGLGEIALSVVLLLILTTW